MDSNRNIFFGDSLRSQLADKVYERFIGGNWFTYKNVMEDYDPKELDTSISKCNKYGELKKAFRAVISLIRQKYPESIEEEGNNRSKRFRYTGDDKDPLADVKNAKVINSLKLYWEFCQDSAGFFPMSWLEYFFINCKDLLKIKERKSHGKQMLISSANSNLANINLLPCLYEHIKNRQVIELDYKPYNEDAMHLVFHPQCLREYNGRWHLLGHAEGRTPEWSFNLALDRITGKIRKSRGIEYMSAPNGFYDNYFADIVGVTHTEGGKPQQIRIRAHDLYLFKLTETKLLHHSQHTVKPFGTYEDGTYGEFEVRVEVNNEFIGTVLRMGAGLEVVSPADVRQTFAQRAEELQQRYKA